MGEDGNPTRKDGGVETSRVDVLTLTLTRDPWHLHVGGTIENHDVAMAMLSQATRYFEQLLKLEALQQMQQSAADAALAEQVRRNLGRN